MSVFSLYCSEIFFQVFCIIALSCDAFLVLHTFVVFVEEPMLKLKFGESYEQYCKLVPRWIPRLKPFRSDISKSS
jgi:protein-S-isoprenylcysteine O-methyltransferase Ste14